jgi:hypothetical protein
VDKFSLTNQHIIITSNEPWGDVWYSKHNYAYELSKQNQVLFLNPTERWRFSNIFGCRITSKRYYKNLSILNYNNILPILNRPLFYINEYLVSMSLRRYFRKKDFSSAILWAFDPNRLCKPGMIGASRSFYHTVDLYSFLPKGERELCRNSDAIFSIANELVKYYKEFKTPIYLIPHGISSGEFSVDIEAALPVDFKLPEYGLYIGYIDERINFQLLENVLKSFPDTPFLFIGNLVLPKGNEAAQRIFIEKKYPNLHHKKAIHFKKLKGYIEKAKFCLAPMDHTMYYNSISHHKLLQYLAFGKPIFACRFIEYESASNLLYMNNEEEETIKSIRKYLTEGESQEIINSRIKYARGFTFEELFKKVEKYINKEN